MTQKDLHSRVLKKLQLLSNYQKTVGVIEKESDKLSEYKAKGKEAGEAEKIRQFLKNK